VAQCIPETFSSAFLVFSACWLPDSFPDIAPLPFADAGPFSGGLRCGLIVQRI
jgi:hypothetical protein